MFYIQFYQGDGVSLFESLEKRGEEISEAMHQFYSNLHVRKEFTAEATLNEVVKVDYINGSSRLKNDKNSNDNDDNNNNNNDNGNNNNNNNNDKNNNDNDNDNNNDSNTNNDINDRNNSSDNTNNNINDDNIVNQIFDGKNSKNKKNKKNKDIIEKNIFLGEKISSASESQKSDYLEFSPGSTKSKRFSMQNSISDFHLIQQFKPFSSIYDDDSLSNDDTDFYEENISENNFVTGKNQNNQQNQMRGNLNDFLKIESSPVKRLAERPVPILIPKNDQQRVEVSLYSVSSRPILRDTNSDSNDNNIDNNSNNNNYSNDDCNNNNVSKNSCDNTNNDDDIFMKKKINYSEEAVEAMKQLKPFW